MKLKQILTIIDQHVFDEIDGKIPNGYALVLPSEVTPRQYDIAVRYYEEATKFLNLDRAKKVNYPELKIKDEV